MVNAERQEVTTIDYLVNTVFAGKPVSAFLMDPHANTWIGAKDHTTNGYRRIGEPGSACISYPCSVSYTHLKDVRFPRLFALMVLATLALLSACNRGAHPAQTGIAAPDFTVSDGANSVHLASYRGRVVLLNFWATWCEPCIVELPSLCLLYTSRCV